MLDELKKKGVDKNTLVVFLSDNGCPEFLGFCDCSNPLGAGKFTYVEGGTRVPFMMAWPGQLKSHKPVSRLVSSLDIMPTVLKAAGVKRPKGLDGRDLVTTVEAPTVKPRTLFWRQKPVYAMRKGEWKLWKSSDWRVTKLFDLKRDPGETTDVSHEHPELVKQLSTKLSGLLPPGTDLQTAASGFKNLGQFVAAVHVSNHLDIPFATLKCTELATADACPNMTVPAKSSSLGQAIHTLKPDMNSSDSKAALKEANKQAQGDIRKTSS